MDHGGPNEYDLRRLIFHAEFNDVRNIIGSFMSDLRSLKLQVDVQCSSGDVAASENLKSTADLKSSIGDIKAKMKYLLCADSAEYPGNALHWACVNKMAHLNIVDYIVRIARELDEINFNESPAGRSEPSILMEIISAKDSLYGESPISWTLKAHQSVDQNMGSVGPGRVNLPGGWRLLGGERSSVTQEQEKGFSCEKVFESNLKNRIQILICALSVKHKFSDPQMAESQDPLLAPVPQDEADILKYAVMSGDILALAASLCYSRITEEDYASIRGNTALHMACILNGEPFFAVKREIQVRQNDTQSFEALGISSYNLPSSAKDKSFVSTGTNMLWLLIKRFGGLGGPLDRELEFTPEINDIISQAKIKPQENLSSLTLAVRFRHWNLVSIFMTEYSGSIPRIDSPPLENERSLFDWISENTSEDDCKIFKSLVKIRSKLKDRGDMTDGGLAFVDRYLAPQTNLSRLIKMAYSYLFIANTNSTLYHLNLSGWLVYYSAYLTLLILLISLSAFRWYVVLIGATVGFLAVGRYMSSIKNFRSLLRRPREYPYFEMNFDRYLDSIELERLQSCSVLANEKGSRMSQVLVSENPFLIGFLHAGLIFTIFSQLFWSGKIMFFSNFVLHISAFLAAVRAYYLTRKTISTEPGFLTPPKDSSELRSEIMLLVSEGKFDDRWWCRSCMTRKSLRSKHCKSCGRCVAKFDHHCPWIFSCVGSGNHIYFVLMLWSLSIGSIINLIDLIKYADEYLKSYISTHSDWNPPIFPAEYPCYIGQKACTFFHIEPFSMSLGLLSCVCVVISTLLAITQTYYASQGMTTNESINFWRYDYMDNRNKAKFKNLPADISKNASHAFDLGLLKNLSSFCFEKAGAWRSVDWKSLHDLPRPLTSPSVSSHYLQVISLYFKTSKLKIQSLKNHFFTSKDNSHGHDAISLLEEGKISHTNHVE